MSKPAARTSPSNDTPPRSSLTPLMSQYWGVKRQYPDAILFFRVGDFFETFYQDARVVSEALGIALTSRDKDRADPVPLAGVPFHAVDGYVARLVRAGHRVAICDQVEDASQAKGLVRRAVTDVVTPGTALSPEYLEEKENQYCLALLPARETWGFSLLDLSTGEFRTGAADPRSLALELGSLPVREIMLSSEAPETAGRWVEERWPGVPVTRLDGYHFDPGAAEESLREHFGVAGLEGFGLRAGDPETTAAGALVRHLKGLREKGLDHVVGLSRWTGGDVLVLDEETVGHLELVSAQPGAPERATLLHQLDRTLTPAGARRLRSWILRPSRQVEAIEARLEAVDDLTGNGFLRDELAGGLRGLGDPERLLGRVVSGRANPRDLRALGRAAERVPALRAALERAGAPLLGEVRSEMDDLEPLRELVARALVDDPPPHLRGGDAIRRGFDERLDRLIEREEEAKRWIAGLQEGERRRTGIPSLKVGYNKVFGYYLEVTRTHQDRVPEDYVCKQTLVSAQRYVTPELKEKESVILSSESERIALEQEIYEDLCRRVAAMSEPIQRTAGALATLDALLALAVVALAHGYVRPRVDESEDVCIVGGRHPVVERLLEAEFVPNDLNMGDGSGRLHLITGPNMAGKSTFLRQNALIFIMAQAGSFVPAREAALGVADRIFTRVGAQDQLAAGRSTFLVEMNETANILNNCTSRSFVILDEIGRGTSTYDGLSIAWAVAERLLVQGRPRPRTLFATHYHELVSLEEDHAGLRNFQMEVREWKGSVVFLHKVVPGGADRSYGIHVAELAGLPPEVVARARRILRALEEKSARLHAEAGGPTARPRQITLFQPAADDPILRELDRIDPEQITPIEAHRILSDLVSRRRS
jgi:DNA mismatch repair protein MutS